MRLKYKIYSSSQLIPSESRLIFLRGDIGDGKSTVAQMLTVIKESGGQSSRIVRSDFIKKMVAVNLGVNSEVAALNKGTDKLETIKERVQRIPSEVVYKIVSHQSALALLSGHSAIVDSTMLLPENLRYYVDQAGQLISLLSGDFNRISVYEAISELYPELDNLDDLEYKRAITSYLVELFVTQPFCSEDLILKPRLDVKAVNIAERELSRFTVIQPSRPDHVAMRDIAIRASNVDNLEFLTTATPEIRKTYAMKKNADLKSRFEEAPVWVDISNSAGLGELYEALSEIFANKSAVAAKGLGLWQEMYR